MRCPSCSFENPEGMNFCGRCATSLSLRCPQCGFDNPPGFAFCGKCGGPLAARPAEKSNQVKSKPKPVRQTATRGKRNQAKVQAAQEPRPAASEAERRQVTVMFCDLVGSTALSTQLDPEELREVVRAYQQTCAQVISRFDGHLAKYLGDGLLVYFGYPVAHEDDPQRAVRAGLGIVDAIRALPRLNPWLQHPLQVRLGIHTGLVVAGEMGGGDTREPLAIVGETPNIAARLQEIAVPATVVLSTATYRLIQGYFACQDLGLHTFKGIATPVPVYQVLEESGAQSRFEVVAATGLTPLVGREQEVRVLLDRWEQVKEGEGQVVLLSGEAGIGKSRLVQELKEQVAREGGTRIEFRCSPYYQNTAFYSVIDHLQRLLQFGREDSPEEKLDKLEKVLQEYRLPVPEVVPLFAALLSLPHPEGYPPLTLSPAKQKQKTQEALIAWLLAVAERQPVLAAWEDLHWADPSTLELQGLLLDQAPTARMLTLMTFRPEFRPPWGARAHLTPLTLNRLGRKQVEAIVTDLTDGKALPAEVVRQIVAKTDGVPLFVEELTKMVVESGLVRQANGHYELTGPLPALAIPATLQDSLMARLDRLAPVREVAQLAATLGREFSYELLQSVSPLDKASLQEALAKLVEAEVLYQRGLPPQAQYVFKHALIQDAAYQSLLKSKRQHYHSQIAQVLEERFAETTETQPELLAHHYTEAGLIAQAIPYWQHAGQRAVQRSANVEAVAHLTKGLELLKTLPETPERISQELTLQLALGTPLMVTKGYVAPEVGHVYARARELCKQMGDTPQLFSVLWGLWAFYAIGGEFPTARELGEQLLTLAQTVPDSALLVEAHHALGETLLRVGEFVAGREHLEQGIALYNPQQHHSLAFLYGLDPGVACRDVAAVSLWYLGYPDQALKRIQEALTLAHELSHPYSLGHALLFAAWLPLLCRREGQLTQERAEAARALASEQEFPLWLALGTFSRGWALAEQGQEEEGIAQMRQGLDACRAMGLQLGRPGVLALLAETQGKVGQVAEGFKVLDEATAVMHKTEERQDEAELYRLKGELTLKQSGVRSPASDVPNTQHPTPSTQAEAEAEECFLQALAVARKQQAKSLELRAAVSLSRLWQKQGKKEEARQMLAEIYYWFTEGFETKDLQEAKALLDELS